MASDLDLIRLNMIKGMTPRAATALLRHFGTAGAALRADSAELLAFTFLSGKQAARISSPPSVSAMPAAPRR